MCIRDRALAGLPYYAEELSGVSLEKLCTDYIDKNIPVILWATMGMRASKTITWTYNGRRIEWVQPEHCLLLVGYDEKHYIFNDPQKSRPLTYYTKESVEKAYKAQFSQAVVILQKGSKYFGDLGRQGYISEDVYKRQGCDCRLGSECSGTGSGCCPEASGKLYI